MISSRSIAIPDLSIKTVSRLNSLCVSAMSRPQGADSRQSTVFKTHEAGESVLIFTLSFRTRDRRLRIAIMANSNSLDLAVIPTSYQTTISAASGAKNAQSVAGALDRMVVALQNGTSTAAQD